MAAYKTLEERERLEPILLENLRSHAPQLEELLAEATDQWVYDDGMYRFYYQSFKVFNLQQSTHAIVQLLRQLAPEGAAFCESFEQIIRDGVGREFTTDDNGRWVQATLPITCAYLHAKYFLEMAVRYSTELRSAHQPMPSGWAALLCLYDIR